MPCQSIMSCMHAMRSKPFLPLQAQVHIVNVGAGLDEQASESKFRSGNVDHNFWPLEFPISGCRLSWQVSPSCSCCLCSHFKPGCALKLPTLCKSYFSARLSLLPNALIHLLHICQKPQQANLLKNLFADC